MTALVPSKAFIKVASQHGFARSAEPYSSLLPPSRKTFPQSMTLDYHNLKRKKSILPYPFPLIFRNRDSLRDRPRDHHRHVLRVLLRRAEDDGRVTGNHLTNERRRWNWWDWWIFGTLLLRFLAPAFIAEYSLPLLIRIGCCKIEEIANIFVPTV